MSFNSLTTNVSRKAYLQDLQKKIGNCNSVKREHPKEYLELLEAFKRHHDYPHKFDKNGGLKDVQLKQTKLGYKTTLVFENGEPDDVSITKHCVSGIAPSVTANLKTAMRESVLPQITRFRSSLRSPACEICGSKNQIEIDHKSDTTPFEKLYKDFMKKNTLSMPTEFQNNMHSSKTFKREDAKFKESWNKYHADHAVFRPLCQPCNGRQPKYKET